MPSKLKAGPKCWHKKITKYSIKPVSNETIPAAANVSAALMCGHAKDQAM